MSTMNSSDVAFAKYLLGFGGMLRLPVQKRDPDTLVPLLYEAREVIAMFRDHCNLGNLALPEERWKEFTKETREAAEKWTKANCLERRARAQFSYAPDLEYGDIRIARVVIIAKEPCALMVPPLHESWWDDLKQRMTKHSEETDRPPHTDPAGGS